MIRRLIANLIKREIDNLKADVPPNNYVQKMKRDKQAFTSVLDNFKNILQNKLAIIDSFYLSL
jgi:hypothetical protein